jgi:hypothetical protein
LAASDNDLLIRRSTTCPRRDNTRDSGCIAAFQLSPCHGKHNLPDQLQVRIDDTDKAKAAAIRAALAKRQRYSEDRA